MPAAVITFSWAANLQLNLLKLRRMVTRNRLSLLYTTLIFVNHFAYVSSWFVNLSISFPNLYSPQNSRASLST